MATTTETTKIATSENEKMRDASCRFPSPSRVAICTDDPAASMSMTDVKSRNSGKTRLMAASADAPRKYPANTPSMTE